MHYNEGEETVRRYWVEVEMKGVTFNGFPSVICKFWQLFSAQNLQQRDENAIDSCHHRSSVGLKLTTRKIFFRVSSSLQREGTNVVNLFYKNYTELLQAIETRIHCFKMRSVLKAAITIKNLLEREENEELLALHGGGRYVLSQDNQNCYASIWHSWSQERKERHIKDIHFAAITVKQTFAKAVNAGRKTVHRQRMWPQKE